MSATKVSINLRRPKDITLSGTTRSEWIRSRLFLYCAFETGVGRKCLLLYLAHTGQKNSLVRFAEIEPSA